MRRIICVAVAAWCFLPATAPAQEKKPRPLNVLLLIADDHAPYVMGCYGNKQVKTPNLDKLAADGIRFDQAYCNAPVCTASRQSFLTGRYPRTLGVTQLSTPLHPTENTLAKILKQAGYTTAAIGKMHFNSNLKHGFDVRLDLPEYRQRLKERGPKKLPDGVDVLGPWRPFKDPADVWLNSKVLPYPAVDEDMAGTYFANESIRFLKDHKDEPFFLISSFNEPHSPFHFPVEFRGRHKPEEFTVPKVGPEDDWQIPKVFRGLTDAQKQGIIAAYYTSVEFLDRNIGLVLAALEKLGLLDDTLIIFIGDHGYLLGHHGRFEKHCLFLQAVRAPLIMRQRQRIRPKQSTSALTEFIDLVPTVLDFTGQPIPKSVQGKSLLPLLDGKTATHRDMVFVEYAENEEAMVRTDRWHLIYGTGKRDRKDGYETGKPLPGRTVLLFDNEKDPEQFTNLAQKPEFAKVVDQLKKALADHLIRTARQPELIPMTDDVHAILEHCLQPRDVGPLPKEKK
jgi:choline-sulfatase